MPPLFHLAFHVTDLDSTRNFYTHVLGAEEGRSTQTWVDFNFYGHQLSCHLGDPVRTTLSGTVGGIAVPMPHFGIVLSMSDWHRIADRLTDQEVSFQLSPMLRFEGQPGEQGTLFINDPSGNAIEIKGFADPTGVYAQ